jgi:hypothetical protein
VEKKSTAIEIIEATVTRTKTIDKMIWESYLYHIIYNITIRYINIESPVTSIVSNNKKVFISVILKIKPSPCFIGVFRLCLIIYCFLVLYLVIFSYGKNINNIFNTSKEKN